MTNEIPVHTITDRTGGDYQKCGSGISFEFIWDKFVVLHN